MKSPIAPNYATLVDELSLAVSRVNAKGGDWLAAQLAKNTEVAVATAFSWAARKLGEHPAHVEIVPIPTPSDGWDAATLGRLALLFHFVDTHPLDAQHRLVSDLYYRGDTPERCAVLRSLALLPVPTSYLLIATDSVRSHVEGVLQAIACENPYPALHFDDLAFNQLVMKAYFTGLSVARVLGLEERKNPELSRMASDFAAERNAAGRPVPPDLSLVTTSPNV